MFCLIIVNIDLSAENCIILHSLNFDFFDSCSLEKRVNKKAIAMFEKAEDEYKDLLSKKNIIEVHTSNSSLDIVFTKQMYSFGLTPSFRVCRMTRQKLRMSLKN